MAQLPPNLPYTANSGTTSTSPFVIQFNARNPTPQDVNYSIQQPWANTLTDEYWILEGFITSAGVITADWRKIGSGSLGVETLTGNSGGAVGPDAAHNIDVVGDGTTIDVVGTPGTNTLTISTGSSVATSFTVDSGVPVVPVGGDVVVTGFPVGTSNLKGMKSFNGGGAGNILEYQSLRDLSRYIVGTSANEAQFTSVQAAIDAAVVDGHTSANPTVIYITPGTYTENLILRSGVHISCVGVPNFLSITKIKGNAVYNPGPGVNIFSSFGLAFETNGGINAAMSIQGANVTRVSFLNCRFVGITGPAFENISSTAIITHQGCSYGAEPGSKVMNLAGSGGSQETFLNCTSQFSDTQSTINGEKCSFFCCIFTDSFLVTNAANPIFINGAIIGHTFGGGNFEALDIDATSQAGLLNTLLDTTAPSGFSVTGTGSLGYNVDSSGQPFNPTLSLSGFTTLTGNISFDGGNTQVSNDGELIIGDTGSIPKIGNITSLDSSITVTNGPGTIDLSTSAATGGADVTAYVSVDIPNVTGDGTNYTIVFDTTLFDTTGSFNTATGTFTAPFTGRYLVTSTVNFSGITNTHTECTYETVTTLNTFRFSESNPAVTKLPLGLLSMNGSLIVPMTIGDTLVANLDVGPPGQPKTIAVRGSGGGKILSYISIRKIG